MGEIATVEDIVKVDIFLCHIDIVNGSMIGEPERRSIAKIFTTVLSLR